MSDLKTSARIFGVFFILAFLSYGIGSGLIESIISTPDILSNVYANKTQFIIGVLLMALVHSFFNIGLAVTLFPILKPTNHRMAYGYFSAVIVATIVLIIGTIFLLLLLPLSDEYIRGSSTAISSFDVFANILKQGGYFSYHLGIAIWGIGGLMLCVLLYKSKLVPRILSIWGFIGYVICILGTVVELFGYQIGVELSLPGGLFEIFLSVWLIVKGFNISHTRQERTNNADVAQGV